MQTLKFLKLFNLQLWAFQPRFLSHKLRVNRSMLLDMNFSLPQLYGGARLVV